MCDYSLCGIPNRLAVEREELVVYRFSTGSIGMASLADLRVCEEIRKAVPRKTFWQAVKAFFEEPSQVAAPPAVCIPPGAHLIVRNIPEDLQRRFRIGQEEAVVFTQLSSEFNSYRDAIRFRGDREIRLQDLREGMPVQVLSLESASEQYAPPAETVDSLV
jgi:hypothetical protein